MVVDDKDGALPLASNTSGSEYCLLPEGVRDMLLIVLAAGFWLALGLEVGDLEGEFGEFFGGFFFTA